MRRLINNSTINQTEFIRKDNYNVISIDVANDKINDKITDDEIYLSYQKADVHLNDDKAYDYKLVNTKNSALGDTHAMNVGNKLNSLFKTKYKEKILNTEWINISNEIVKDLTNDYSYITSPKALSTDGNNRLDERYLKRFVDKIMKNSGSDYSKLETLGQLMTTCGVLDDVTNANTTLNKITDETEKRKTANKIVSNLEGYRNLDVLKSSNIAKYGPNTKIDPTLNLPDHSPSNRIRPDNSKNEFSLTGINPKKYNTFFGNSKEGPTQKETSPGIITPSDKSVSVNNTDGSKTVTYPDTTTELTKVDGSRIITRPNGNVEQVDIDNNVIITRPTGVVTTTVIDNNKPLSILESEKAFPLNGINPKLELEVPLDGSETLDDKEARIQRERSQLKDRHVSNLVKFGGNVLDTLGLDHRTKLRDFLSDPLHLKYTSSAPTSGNGITITPGADFANADSISDGFAASGTDIMGQLTNQFDNTIGEMQKSIGDVAGKYLDNLGPLKNEFIDLLGSMGIMELLAKYGIVIDKDHLGKERSISDIYKNSVDKAKQAKANLISGADSAKKRGVKMFTSLVDQMMDKIQSKVDEYSAMFAKFTGGISGGIMSMVGGAIDNAIGQVKGMIDGYIAKIQSFITELKDTINNIKKQFTNIYNSIKSGYDNIKNAMGNINLTSIKDLFSSLNGIGQAINKLLNNIINAACSMIQSILDLLDFDFSLPKWNKIKWPDFNFKWKFPEFALFTLSPIVIDLSFILPSISLNLNLSFNTDFHLPNCPALADERLGKVGAVLNKALGDANKSLDRFNKDCAAGIHYNIDATEAGVNALNKLIKHEATKLTDDLYESLGITQDELDKDQRKIDEQRESELNKNMYRPHYLVPNYPLMALNVRRNHSMVYGYHSAAVLPVGDLKHGTGIGGSTGLSISGQGPTLLPPTVITTITLPDGSTSTTYPSGKKEILYIDGSKSIESPDGTKEIFKSDGSKTMEYPNGSKEIIKKDGTRMIYNPEGSITNVYIVTKKNTDYKISDGKKFMLNLLNNQDLKYNYIDHISDIDFINNNLDQGNINTKNMINKIKLKGSKDSNLNLLEEYLRETLLIA